MKKNLLKVGAAIALAAISLGATSCISSDKLDIATAKIGILQFANVSALDNARLGFEKALKDAGVKESQIEVYNAGGKAADQTMFAKTLSDTCDLLLGIATPSAVALKGAEDNSGYEKPLLFTAVTDPVDANLVSSKENTEGFVCGTSDATPIEEQVALIKEIIPDVDKVGILYTESETNSLVQAEQVSAACQALNIEAVLRTCTSSNDIKTAAQALADVEGLDAFYIPTDNNIAEHMQEVTLPAKEKGMLVMCGEEGMVQDGGHVSLSIDYLKLGEATGEMAVAILKGEKDPTSFPVESVKAKDCAFVFNSNALNEAGIRLSEEIRSAHEWKDLANA